MIHIVWPSVVNCVFAAFLYTGGGEKEFQIQPVPVKQTSHCQSIHVSIHHRSLVLVKGYQRVEIPLPPVKRKEPLEYHWGFDKAFIGQRLVNVKMGPKTIY